MNTLQYTFVIFLDFYSTIAIHLEAKVLDPFSANDKKENISLAMLLVSIERPTLEKSRRFIFPPSLDAVSISEHTMRPSTKLLHACRITFFTRSNCSLCDNAKLVLSRVWDQRHFNYVEVPVMEPQHQKWQIYQFDTPVVCCL